MSGSTPSGGQPIPSCFQPSSRTLCMRFIRSASFVVEQLPTGSPMMFSPPSSPSVLASTSRHNIIQPQQPSQLHRQKSLRLFLGHQSDEEASSDLDFDHAGYVEDDSDSDADSWGRPSGSTSSCTLAACRLSASTSATDELRSPSRVRASLRAYDQDEDWQDTLPSPSKRPTKRPRAGKSPVKGSSSRAAATTTKQQAALPLPFPARPQSEQKAFSSKAM